MLRRQPRSTLFPYTTALPICHGEQRRARLVAAEHRERVVDVAGAARVGLISERPIRSEEHTSELQSRRDLVCRLLLEKKKQYSIFHSYLYVSDSDKPAKSNIY